MPTLQVRDVPEHIYREFVRQAGKERRSLAQQTVAVLAKGIGTSVDARERRREVLRRIRETVDRFTTRRLPDSVKLIREDRDRRESFSTRMPLSKSC